MKDRYVLYNENGVLENVMSREEAIEKAKQYFEHGINAYIVSETEDERIQKSKEGFQPPKWE